MRKWAYSAGALSAVSLFVGFGIKGALGHEVSAWWAALGFFGALCFAVPDALNEFRR